MPTNDTGCNLNDYRIDPISGQKITAYCIGDLDKGLIAGETNGNDYNMNVNGGVLKITLSDAQSLVQFREADGTNAGQGTVRDQVTVPVRP